MAQLTLTTVDGVYQWGEVEPPLRRFTAFVFYPDDPASNALDVDALGTVDGIDEEIDVNATTEEQARLVALAALVRDYEPGGRIVEIEERHGWYL